MWHLLVETEAAAQRQLALAVCVFVHMCVHKSVYIFKRERTRCCVIEEACVHTYGTYPHLGKPTIVSVSNGLGPFPLSPMGTLDWSQNSSTCACLCECVCLCVCETQACWDCIRQKGRTCQQLWRRQQNPTPPKAPHWFLLRLPASLGPVRQPERRWRPLRRRKGPSGVWKVNKGTRRKRE